jgi:hypothetical protein
VARRHDLASAVVASGAEARVTASRGKHDEEKMSFALSWTTLARDKEALGGVRGFGRKQWAPLGHCSDVTVGGDGRPSAWRVV